MSRIPLLAMLLGALSIAACSRPAGTAAADAATCDTAVAVTTASPDTTVTIAMTGDVMLGTEYPERKMPPDGGRSLFADAAPVLRAADAACGNQEGVLGDGLKPRSKPKSKFSYYFLTPSRMARLEAEAGYDFMSMANNHALDFLAPGVASTRRVLDAHGIGHAGTDGDEMAVKHIGGVTYGFAAFGHNWGTLLTSDTARVSRIVRRLRQQADVVIVSFHGGGEGLDYRRLPHGVERYLGDNRGNVRQFARLCVDRGADVVYGHGPHVVRAVEVYRGHLIAYSLGNFCTPCGISVAGKCGLAPLLTATISRATGRLVHGRIHSMVQGWGTGPRLDPQHRAAREIAALTAADIAPPFRPRITPDGHITPPLTK